MFDLQRFADGGEATGEGQQQQQSTPVEGVEIQDVSEQNQSAKSEIDIDAKINDALTKAQKNFEEMLKKREAAAKKEAERLSRLSDEERQKAEIENGRKELELREKELQRKELMLEMTKVLAERKIPIQFMDYLIADDSESTLNRITTFEKEYKTAIEIAVNDKLKGKIPPTTAGNKNQSVNATPRVKDSFMKIIADNQVKRF